MPQNTLTEHIPGFEYRATLAKPAIENDEMAGGLGKPLSGAGGPRKDGHGLVPLLKYVDQIYSVFGLHWPNEKMPWNEARDLIQDLDAVDSGSFAFRYPMKRDGAPFPVNRFWLQCLRIRKNARPGARWAARLGL